MPLGSESPVTFVYALSESAFLACQGNEVLRHDVKTSATVRYGPLPGTESLSLDCVCGQETEDGVIVYCCLSDKTLRVGTFPGEGVFSPMYTRSLARRGFDMKIVTAAGETSVIVGDKSGSISCVPHPPTAALLAPPPKPTPAPVPTAAPEAETEGEGEGEKKKKKKKAKKVPPTKADRPEEAPVALARICTLTHMALTPHTLCKGVCTVGAEAGLAVSDTAGLVRVSGFPHLRDVEAFLPGSTATLSGLTYDATGSVVVGTAMDHLVAWTVGETERPCVYGGIDMPAPAEGERPRQAGEREDDKGQGYRCCVCVGDTVRTCLRGEVLTLKVVRGEGAALSLEEVSRVALPAEGGVPVIRQMVPLGGGCVMVSEAGDVMVQEGEVVTTLK
ncbi:hypothetical protein KIPB_000685 [Kipferlia bialata]|uniref:Uncharacterized protein n=1 Tax=Kipferlia bialata TaxID=797122 RepID=A0A9K3CQX7_9EUKA|nr:hypothetical protein KIPB_000685 [Kipferlia bialata]|eukprot:g685.t1